MVAVGAGTIETDTIIVILLMTGIVPLMAAVAAIIVAGDSDAWVTFKVHGNSHIASIIPGSRSNGHLAERLCMYRETFPFL